MMLSHDLASGVEVANPSGAARGVFVSQQESKMNALPVPTRTAKALQFLGGRIAESDRIRGVLLANSDGHRNVIELESFARALGLEFDELLHLRHEGLIDFAA